LRINLVINAASQEILVRFFTSFRAFRSFAIEHQLHGIENGRLAATVHASEENDGLRISSHNGRSQIELMLAPVDAEVCQFEFVNDHELFFPASGVA
jgi:hypothetical protein